MTDHEKLIKMYADFIVLCNKEIDSVKRFHKGAGDVFLLFIAGGVILFLAGLALMLIPILILKG